MNCQLQLVVRQHLIIARPVEPGVGVEDRALILQGGGYLCAVLFVVSRRPFKEHMLQQVRRPGMTDRFVSRTDPIHNHKSDNRRGVTRHKQDLQVVRVEFIFGDSVVFGNLSKSHDRYYATSFTPALAVSMNARAFSTGTIGMMPCPRFIMCPQLPAFFKTSRTPRLIDSRVPNSAQGSRLPCNAMF